MPITTEQATVLEHINVIERKLEDNDGQGQALDGQGQALSLQFHRYLL